jgi:CRISPR/Cas system-associated protein Csx1
MLKHIAGGKDKIICVVVTHNSNTLQFKIDDKIQLAVEVDTKKGLKAGSSFELIMDDLSIEPVEGGAPLPTAAVAQSPSSRGCNKDDAAFLKGFNC